MEHRNSNKPRPQGHHAPLEPIPEMDKKWILNGLDASTVIWADKCGKILTEGKLTTSQIRSLFGEMRRIQLKGFEQEKTKFLMLKPKMAYVSKRHKDVKAMPEFKKIIDQGWDIISAANPDQSETYFNNFMNLFEAVLAYHKFHGGQ
jgi:CRISPR-associated protein Csm2